jgi:hypothetical protein
MDSTDGFTETYGFFGENATAPEIPVIRLKAQAESG